MCNIYIIKRGFYKGSNTTSPSIPRTFSRSSARISSALDKSPDKTYIMVEWI
jgi:hypothetical protein